MPDNDAEKQGPRTFHGDALAPGDVLMLSPNGEWFIRFTVEAPDVRITQAIIPPKLAAADPGGGVPAEVRGGDNRTAFVFLTREHYRLSVDAIVAGADPRDHDAWEHVAAPEGGPRGLD